MSKEVTAFESGLHRFVRLDKKADFVGRAALAKQQEAGSLRWKLATLLIDGPDDADPWGVESVWSNGSVVGRATGGGYSAHFGKQIAMAFLRPEHAAVGTSLTVKMLDRHCSAEVVVDSPYDPDNARARQDAN